MITIANIDGLMWDLDLVIPDIIAEYQQFGHAVIDLNSEGPDAGELKLYSILDNICNKFNFRKNLITIKTRNVLESHPEYNIVINEPLYVNECQWFAKNNPLPKKTITKHFGIFIGRSNWTRLDLSAEIYNLYKDKSLQTFHYDSSSDFHKGHLGLEQLMHIDNCTQVKRVSDLLLASPIRTELPEYPIISPEHLSIAKLYHNFFVEIVCETYCKGKTFYPTEKIWRPLICLTPFMVQGPVDYLKNLRRLGFKTFSEYWDESYDEDGFYGINTIKHNLKNLSLKSTQELTDMYNDMIPLLEHNKKVFMSLDRTSWDIFK
jgi:hypothetical protein